MKKILTLLLVALVALSSCNEPQTSKESSTPPDSTNQKKTEAAVAPFVPRAMDKIIDSAEFSQYRLKFDTVLKKFMIKKATKAVGFHIDSIAYYLSLLDHAGYDSVYIYFGALDASDSITYKKRHLKLTTILWRSPFQEDSKFTDPPKPYNAGQLYHNSRI